MCSFTSVSTPALRRNRTSRAYRVHPVPRSTTTNTILTQLDTHSLRARFFVAHALAFHGGRWAALRPGTIRIGDNAFRRKFFLRAHAWGIEIRQPGMDKGRRIIDARSRDGQYRRAARKLDVLTFWAPVAA